MDRQYRTDYLGEFYIKARNQFGGASSENREWIPNTIPAFAHSGNAVVIGNGPSRTDIPLHYLTNHGGSHKGKKKLTTYGCNALYRDMAPHFLVATGTGVVTEIVESDYCSKNIVLTHPEHIIENPGKFHLIPFDKHWNAGCIATWLACFDGHKKIYLLGFDNQTTQNVNRNVYAGTPGYDSIDTFINDTRWIEIMYDIMESYSDVDFVWVNPVHMPESWRYLENLRQMDIRGFVYDADLGA